MPSLSSSNGNIERTVRDKHAVRMCETMLSRSHQSVEAVNSSAVGGCESGGGYMGKRSGHEKTPGAGGLLI